MERSNKTPLIASLVVVVALVIGGLLIFNGRDTDQNNAAATKPASTQQEDEKTTIVDAASANADFSTLVTAVKAADLTGALSADEKLTVFAPTNAAFEKLPAGTVETLVKPENKEALTGILTYHVVKGEVLSSQLQNGQIVTTLNGAELTVTIENGSVYLTDAKGGRAMVTMADMKVDNGVIHAIDRVLMPS